MGDNLKQLWVDFVSTRQLKIRETLVLNYVNLVRYVLNRMFPSCASVIEQQDLESEGVIGLIEAVDRFDPQKNVKFETFAIHRIKGAVLDALRASDWAPRSVRRKARKVQRAIAELEGELGRQPEESEIAKRLGIDLATYHDLLDTIVTIRYISLNDSAPNQLEDSLTNEEFIPNPNQSSIIDEQEHQEIKQLLIKAMDGLPKKERLVLALYYYENLTMKEIAMVLSVNESRVSQIHTQAVLRLRSVVELTPV